MIPLVGVILVGAGLIGLVLIAGIVHYQRKIAQTLREDPELARRIAIRTKTKTSYRSK